MPATAEKLPEVRRAGYSLMNRDGRRLYCRRAPRTGAHARFETTCLTAEQLDALKEATQRGAEAMRRTQPPQQGG